LKGRGGVDAMRAGQLVAAQPPSQSNVISRAGMDPPDSGQWGLQMVRSDVARRIQAGRSQVRVGILSTGVDLTHPDLAENFDRPRSRNFVTDIPTDELGQIVDGP
jgi:hypothetical protein